MDGKAVLSCMTLTVECDGKTITTIEGLKDPKIGTLDPLQQAFIDYYDFQCGFCTPGIIVSAKALLNENPSPTEEEVKEALRFYLLSLRWKRLWDQALLIYMTSFPETWSLRVLPYSGPKALKK